MKLIVFDMDGVIFKPRNIWLELHKRYGTFEEGKELTEKYLHSDYSKLIEEVVNKLWKGRDEKPFLDLIKETEYIEGVQEVFNKINVKTAIISSGSIRLARRAQKDLGIDYVFANELVVKDNKISGEFIWPTGAGKKEKVVILKRLSNELGIDLKEVIYVGDSDIDVEAFKVVGKSIAFNAVSEELKKIADVVIDKQDLREILPHLEKL
jgi:phosphoserine phosphatase